MKFKSIVFVCAVLLGSWLTIDQANAQDTKAKPKAAANVFFAILDTDAVIAQSKAMKNIHEQMAKHQANIQTVIDKEKLAAKKEEEELVRKRNLLAPEVLAEERKKFQNRIVALQRQVQESNQKLTQIRAEATAKVSEVFRTVVADVVKLNGITVVLRKTQVVFANPNLEITAIVLEDLDKRLPSVQVANPNK